MLALYLIGPDGRRAPTPWFWTHVNPYGRFRVDEGTRPDLAAGRGQTAVTG